MFSNLEYPDEGSNRTAGAQVDPNLCLLQSKCASGASMIYANFWEIEKNRFPQISTEKVTDSHRFDFRLSFRSVEIGGRYSKWIDQVINLNH